MVTPTLQLQAVSAERIVAPWPARAHGNMPDCWNVAIRCSGVSEASNDTTMQTTSIRTKIKAYGAKVLLSRPVRSIASNSCAARIGMFSFLPSRERRLAEFQSRFGDARNNQTRGIDPVFPVIEKKFLRLIE